MPLLTAIEFRDLTCSTALSLSGISLLLRDEYVNLSESRLHGSQDAHMAFKAAPGPVLLVANAREKSRCFEHA
jgi:hypothetical protein